MVVVEAARRSGSLITARIAQELGREVFAVPGSPLDPRARGGNDLIREGAILTETAEDVLDNLSGFGALFPSGPSTAGNRRRQLLRFRGHRTNWSPRATPTRSRVRVVALLGPTPTKVDDLLRRCQLSPAAVMAVLLELELAGRVETLPGNRFALLTEAGS